MSKETDIKQTSSQEGSHANPLVLQEREEERKMTAISGMKLLESSESVNLDGSLGKMLKALLTSPKVRSCSRYKKIWKQRVSKSNVLLFQLQASVRGIKGKGFGLLHTPTATEIGLRSRAAMEKRKKYRKSIGRKTVPPGNLLEQIQMMYPTPTQDSASERTKKYKQGGTPLPLAVKMYPTPNATNINTPQSERVEQTKSGSFILRKKNKPHMTYGARLQDAMLYLEKKMMPTPSASEHKYRLKGNTQASKCLEAQARKLGGKLNPHFVEFLMGYPMNWTKIEPTELKVSETQSFPSSQENLDSPSSKQKRMYRTPTAMDIAEDSFIFAAKLLKGKINRSSNSRVQITLSTDVAMEYLKSNPHLIDEYDKPFKIRPNLPNKFEFISYLKSNSTIKDLANKTDLPKTKIEHWFRKDKCFSYPSIEDWNKIKPHLKTIQFDDELTYEIDEDWKS